MTPDPKQTCGSHEKITIAISGTADTSFLGQAELDESLKIGAEVARQGAALVSGATTGIPLWAAKGCKEAGGLSIGLSPALSKEEHVEKWKLPTDFMDVIMYVGGGYAYRDVVMVRSADAMAIGPGRIGTLHEFTTAFEDNKPIGILTGPWDTDDEIKMILEKSHRAGDNKKIIYDADPSKLVRRLVELVKIDRAEVDGAVTTKLPVCAIT